MKNVSIAGESFACCNYKFALVVCELFAPGACVLVGAVNGNVEINVPLPRALQHGLTRTVMWCEPLPFRSRHEPTSWLVWRSGGVTYNVRGWGALADLLAEVAALKGSKK